MSAPDNMVANGVRKEDALQHLPAGESQGEVASSRPNLTAFLGAEEGIVGQSPAHVLHNLRMDFFVLRRDLRGVTLLYWDPGAPGTPREGGGFYPSVGEELVLPPQNLVCASRGHQPLPPRIGIHPAERRYAFCVHLLGAAPAERGPSWPN